LLLGILIFSFYQNSKPPIYFDSAGVAEAKQLGVKKDSLQVLELQYEYALANNNREEATAIRKAYSGVIKRALKDPDAKDTNYIFLWFVKENLPVGLIGLILAVIFLASWGSIAAALNSLAACSVVDFHKKFFAKSGGDANDYTISQWYTFGWGVFCIIISMFAYNIGNSLIEAVNIIGSVFYGVILGVFLTAFWLKHIKGHAVFYAALIAQLLVVVIYRLDIISFLWLNVIGALLVLLLSLLLQPLLAKK
jgi:solute:Na+ symporter, SSS family